ncbi:glutaminase family protein [Fimbriimonas ginsengisoli]|uniref:Glutaminase A n=1 Tax=Fimbriimonas ginsengisoli Gsoil 348 TaxID=661478 RepID=A0A068NVE7_FIMGI|nr:glutaminase family protein [Fimbriimonas ginsengisoli]AIE86755.1 Glutaminase A [Fimbriimonas ginsengisoli Gsoil 348]
MLAAPLLASLLATQIRPPAVPLVACDPYFSIWSRANRLTDVPTTHWTGATHALTSMIRIDGRAYRIMGTSPDVPALDQRSVQVLPTRSIYKFQGRGVAVALTFMTPALPDDLSVLSRPVTYLTWDVRSVDRKRHKVQLYFDAAPEIAIDQPGQKWAASVVKIPGLAAGKVGAVDQHILGKTGDDRRIDWGYLYTATPTVPDLQMALTVDSAGAFAQSGKRVVPGGSRSLQPRPAAFTFDLGAVSAAPKSRWVVLAYDDLYSIQYFHQNLRPFWRRNGMDAAKLLTTSAKEYGSLKARCERFDGELMADLRKAGGEKYALMGALAYRQCLAGNKIAADANGQPLLFPKENTSNGCIGTVDVIFPMAPQFLLFGPALTKAMVVSNLDYASSPRWKWPFAPHDLGTYPKANGQVYGGGERTEDDQMPVEETGNMLILVAALAKMEGNASFAAKYWPTLTRWAEYLRAKGFDPENQLSTDDFMGHLAHNTNLSVKATLGLASYGYLCDVRSKERGHGGLRKKGAEYRGLAQSFATRWVREANDGDHFRLAFDKPGSWSQKYNLVWDRILGFNLFPAAAIRKEVAFYRKIANPYGVALDSREGGVKAKVDWSLWSACLTGSRADFDAIADPVFRYLNESPNRVPMGDLYDTSNGHHVGMHSRPVVGGVFLKMLYDGAMWKKWAGRNTTRVGGWAPLPKPPVFRPIVPTSEKSGLIWSYTLQRPAQGWFAPTFDASSWSTGPGGFGTNGTPGAVVRTEWNTPDIWIRREFTLSALPTGELYLRLYHDEDAEVYLNGVQIARESGWVSAYDDIPLGSFAAQLRPGRNVFAVHCHQTGGGQGVDVGIVQRIR